MECEYEDMEFEYTNSQPFFNSGFYNNHNSTTQMYKLPPKGTFSIPSSFFDDSYKKSNIITNAVCSLLDKFTLEEKEEEKVQPVEENQPEKPVEVIESPPLQPTEETNIEPQDLNSSQEMIENDSVHQSESLALLPSSPIQSVDSNTKPEIIENQIPQLSTYQQQQQQQQPSHTFIYHAAPNTPIDPLRHSHSVVYYITGLLKLVCKTIIFVGVFYVLTQVVVNFHQDMKDKIASYESDLLDDQLYCQQQYELNRCEPNTRLPAVKDLCRSWEKCMWRPISVSKTKVLGETFADLFNGFVNTLSVRTMVYTTCIGLGVIWSFASFFSSNTKTKVHQLSNSPHSYHSSYNNSHQQQENNQIPDNPTIKKLELQPYY